MSRLIREAIYYAAKTKILRGKTSICHQQIFFNSTEFPSFTSKYFLFDIMLPMDTISFSDFKKLDLRIGEIKEVADINGYDKLYRLKVDLGEGDCRTLVAGVRQQFSKEDLIGYQVVIVTNLESKEIAGVESRGMLLAADDNNEPVLVVPCKKVQAGMKVR